MTTVALVTDLMDRSRISGAVPGVAFASGPDACAGADVVIVDLGGHAEAVAGVRRVAPDARIVAFGRHDNPDALTRAQADGADVAVARSRFFRDPAAVVTP
ncbi:MAG: DNA-binding response regulator [Acidimicrobiia bacterium]